MLSKILRVKTDNRAVVKESPIKVTQKDVDDLDRKIAQDVEAKNKQLAMTEEIAEDELMR